MTSSRPSRWLAPLALLAALGAVWLVIQSSTSDSESDGSTQEASPEERRASERSEGEGDTGTTRTATGPRKKTYTVRPGDTLALIAERTGVTVEELLALNPDIDPNSLTVGVKIKLTE
jgi:LysM repeat protein